MESPTVILVWVRSGRTDAVEEARQGAFQKGEVCRAARQRVRDVAAPASRRGGEEGFRGAVTILPDPWMGQSTKKQNRQLKT